MMRSYNKHLLQQLLTQDHKKSLEDLFQHAHLKLQRFRVPKITDNRIVCVPRKGKSTEAMYVQ